MTFTLHMIFSLVNKEYILVTIDYPVFLLFWWRASQCVLVLSQCSSWQRNSGLILSLFLDSADLTTPMTQSSRQEYLVLEITVVPKGEEKRTFGLMAARCKRMTNYK